MSQPPLNQDQAGAMVDATVPLLGIPLEPAWRDAVVANVQMITAAARLVLEFLLDDEVEPAPVFRS